MKKKLHYIARSSAVSTRLRNLLQLRPAIRFMLQKQCVWFRLMYVLQRRSPKQKQCAVFRRVFRVESRENREHQQNFKVVKAQISTSTPRYPRGGATTPRGAHSRWHLANRYYFTTGAHALPRLMVLRDLNPYDLAMNLRVVMPCGPWVRECFGCWQNLNYCWQ